MEMARSVASKDMVMRVQYGDLKTEIIVENQGWNPDVADDVISRIKALWRDSLDAMVQTGAWNMVDVDEDE